MAGGLIAMQRDQDRKLTRNRPFDARRSCLLLIDAQNLVWNPSLKETRPYFYERARDVVLPNLRRLIDEFHRVGAEVMYTVIQDLTKDGRDRSLDYKVSGFSVSPGSWEGKVLQEVAPGNDDIVLPKTSSGVFNSTNIEYLLRNIGIDTLVVTGFITDQCIDHTVRDAADRGFYPICLSDGCATHTQARHDNALAAFAGYCRTMATAELLAEVARAQNAVRAAQ
jgi:nicotinamidase-related amidase